MRKKAISSILLTAMLVGVFSGCGAGNKEASNALDMSQGTKMSGASDGAQNAEASGASDGERNAEASTGVVGPKDRELSSGEGGILDPFAVQALEGKDNSLDAYSAVARFSLQTENPENAVEGGLSGSFLGVSRAYCFKKHLFSEWKECWDEISFVSAEDEPAVYGCGKRYAGYPGFLGKTGKQSLLCHTF